MIPPTWKNAVPSGCESRSKVTTTAPFRAAREVSPQRGLTIHGYGRDRTGALVSSDLMYRIGRRWSVGLELSSYTQSHTYNAGLRSEFHF